MKNLLWAIVVTFSFLLGGCGGGSSGSNPSSNSQNPASPADESKKEDADTKVSAEPEVDATGTSPAPAKPEPAPMPAAKKPEPAPMPAAKKPEPAPMPAAKKPEPAPMPAAKKPEPAPMPAAKKPEPAPMPAAKKPEPAPMPPEKKPNPMPAPAPEKRPAPTPPVEEFAPLPASIEKSVGYVEAEIAQIAKASAEDYKKYVSDVVRNMWAPASLNEKALVEKFTAGTQEEGARKLKIYTMAVRYFYPEKDYGFGKGFTPELPWDECFAMAEKFSSRPNGLRELKLFQMAYTYASQGTDTTEPSQPHGLRTVYAYEFAHEIAFKADGAKVLATHRRVFNEHIQYEKGQPNITLNWEDAYNRANQAAGIEIPKKK